MDPTAPAAPRPASPHLPPGGPGRAGVDGPPDAGRRAVLGADRVLTVVQHEDDVPLDRFAGWLAPAQVRVVRAHRGDPVPAGPADVGDGLVVLGGTMDAYADGVAPWLPQTRALLAAVARSDVPALGICLGAQLLAVATGGRVEVAAAAGRESGVVAVDWREGAARDPLVGGLAAGPAAGRLFPTMHSDAVVDLPPDAVPLARSVLHPHQAFRVGSAWGVQFHPETSVETFIRWAQESDVDDAAAVAQLRRHEAEVARTGHALALAFAGLVERRATARAAVGR